MSWHRFVWAGDKIFENGGSATCERTAKGGSKNL